MAITIPMFFTIFSLVKHLLFSDVSQVFLYLAACFYSVFFCNLFNWTILDTWFHSKKKQELVYSSKKIKMPSIL